MAPTLEHMNETCTTSETWQLIMNHDQNNGAIHIYQKFYILGTIETLGDFGPIVYPQNPLYCPQNVNFQINMNCTIILINIHT